MWRVRAGAGPSAPFTLDAGSKAVTLFSRRLTVETCLCDPLSILVRNLRSRHVYYTSKVSEETKREKKKQAARYECIECYEEEKTVGEIRGLKKRGMSRNHDITKMY